MIEFLGHKFYNTCLAYYTCSDCNVKVRGSFAEEGRSLYLDIDLYGKKLSLTCKEQQIKNLLE